MFANILCATDLNDASSQAVSKAVQLAHQYNSNVIMLNVHEEFMSQEEMGMLRVSMETMKSTFEATALKAKNEMRELIKVLHAEDINVEYLLKEGKPSRVICEEAIKQDSDLIIMGVGDKGLFSSFIYKSTASYVIEHVRIPVLVVPLK